MKVTMMTTLAGPAGVALRGSILNLPDAEAQLLMKKNESGGPWARKTTADDEKKAPHKGMQKYHREDE